MAAHSSILAWEIPWTEEPDELVHGVAESDVTERVYIHTHICVEMEVFFPLCPILAVVFTLCL